MSRDLHHAILGLTPNPDLGDWMRHLGVMIEYEATHSVLALCAIAADRADDRSQVYFIQVGRSGTGPIKIGISVDFASRLAALQAANPYQLVTLGVFPGGLTVERLMHSWFKHLRLNGEWFRASPELLAFIMAFHAARHEAEGAVEYVRELEEVA